MHTCTSIHWQPTMENLKMLSSIYSVGTTYRILNNKSNKRCPGTLH